MQISRKKARTPIEKIDEGYPNRIHRRGNHHDCQVHEELFQLPIIREPRGKSGTTLDLSDW